MSASDPVSPTATRRWDRAILFGVLVLVAGLAALLYARFLPHNRQLWVSSTHDRNAHYLTALTLAEAVRHARPLVVLAELNGARVWGPLHPVLAAVALLLGGPDSRLAVLPSLAGWAATAVFAFLAARRAAPRHGNLAGLAALLLVLGGPAHRGYATDVMLESLGAGLTLAALYCYLVAAQERTLAAGRWLALTLTLLFFEKYNYWLIVLGAIGLATLPELWRRYGAAARTWLAGLDWRARLRGEARRPSSWLIIAAVAASVAIYLHGDRPVTLAGHTLSLYPPFNVLQVAYVVFFVRVCWWWRAGGREWADRLDLPWRPLVRGHVWPALLWMLLPKHLGYFVWFLSPANAPQQANGGALNGLAFYWPRLTETYHASGAVVLAAAVLFVVTVLAWRRLRPGSAALLCCFALGAALTVNHPNHQVRYLHSWLAAGWVAAGVGLAVLLPRRLGAAAGAAAVVGLALLCAPGWWAGRPAPEGGPRPGAPCVRELTDFYADDLRGAGKSMVLTEVPFRFTARWAALEQRPDAGTFGCAECYRGGLTPRWARERQALLDWLAGCDCDTIVSVEDGPHAAYWEYAERGRLYEPLGVLLREQGSYRPVKCQEFPRHNCVVTVWKRQRG